MTDRLENFKTIHEKLDVNCTSKCIDLHDPISQLINFDAVKDMVVYANPGKTCKFTQNL
jgi:hypothetical protein